MSHSGSASPSLSRPLPPAAALALTVLGVAAMFVGTPVLAQSLGVSHALRLQIALGTILLALPALVVLAARPAAWHAALGDEPAGRRMLLLSGLLGAALWVFSIGLMEMQSIVVPPRQEYLDGFRALHHALAPSGPADVLASLAVIAVLPGLCEELVVRGVLLPSLVAGLLSSFERMGRSLNPEYGATSRSRVSAGATHGAVLMSAVLFAAMHADPYRFLFTLTIGLVLGVLRLRTGSLWSPVAAHVTLNALTFFVAPLVDDPSQPYTPQPVLGLLCLVAGAAVAGPLLRALRPSVDSPQAAA